MLKFILRNMWRRKGRTLLTIIGIVVGIFAFTVLSGLSARLNQQLGGAKKFYTNHITVVPTGGNLFGAEGKYLPLSKVAEINAVPGVKGAIASIGLPLDAQSGAGFGAPELIVGTELSDGGPELLAFTALQSGRLLQDGDSRKVLLGLNLANKFNAGPGDTVQLRGVDFQVVGIYKATLTAPDSLAFVSYQDGLDLFRAANPYFQVADIAGTIDVLPQPGVGSDQLAATIQNQVADIKAISPNEAVKQISQFSLIFNAILIGISLVALLVGSLSIINTMIMSVSERTREIGLKKAIGAETRSVLGEYLLESALIGVLGGLIGMGLGVTLIAVLNTVIKTNGASVFAISRSVVLTPVIFATFLGTLAGIFPALRAARLKPVEALKED
jgi:putative ABC transport system permease protein